MCVPCPVCDFIDALARRHALAYPLPSPSQSYTGASRLVPQPWDRYWNFSSYCSIERSSGFFRPFLGLLFGIFEFLLQYSLVFHRLHRVLHAVLKNVHQTVLHIVPRIALRDFRLSVPAFSFFSSFASGNDRRFLSFSSFGVQVYLFREDNEGIAFLQLQPWSREVEDAPINLTTRMHHYPA